MTNCNLLQISLVGRPQFCSSWWGSTKAWIPWRGTSDANARGRPHLPVHPAQCADIVRL